MARIEIEVERCKGCGLCVDVCPEDCLSIGNEVNSAGWRVVAVVEPDKCKGCAMCAETCPDVAIEVFK